MRNSSAFPHPLALLVLFPFEEIDPGHLINLYICSEQTPGQLHDDLFRVTEGRI